VHLIKGCVFDVDHRTIADLQFCTDSFDPFGKFSDFGLGLNHL